MDKIKESARLAYADEFIQALPDGYASIVGERGIKLSGGQRQRVAVARAILANRPLFLLDEATSALDSDSESKIQSGLVALMEGKTVIAIAHRLSTLSYMDRIIFLEGGTIVEDGTHDELILREGKYAELWRMQAGGFLPDV
jgi:ATP-binding cassette subfamily B protein